MKRITRLATLFATTGLLALPLNLARADSPTAKDPAHQAPTAMQCKMCNCGRQQGQQGMMRHGMGGAMGQEGMQGMMHGGMMGSMAEHHEQANGPHQWAMMRQHRREMLAKLRSMESNLDQKLDAMNEATGREKLADMAAVLNELVHQRDEIINHITHMMGRMERHPEMMGQPSMNGGQRGAARRHQEHHEEHHHQGNHQEDHD